MISAASLFRLVIGENILTTPLYGTINDEAYYYLNLFVGNPPQKQSVILDTGSSILAFPCHDCEKCGRHINQPYSIDNSGTSRWLTCDDEMCFSKRCSVEKSNHSEINHCDYYQAYSEGSSISGHYFSDLISLTAYRTTNNAVKGGIINYETQLTNRYDHIGCHERETKLFVSQLANGIIGVAFPHKNQPSAIDALFQSSPDYVDSDPGQDVAIAKVFSICISDQGGVMTMGGYDPIYVKFGSKIPPEARTGGHARALHETSAKETLNPFHPDELKTKVKQEHLMISTKMTSAHSYTIGATSMRYHEDNHPPGALTELSGHLGNTIIDSGTTYSYFPPLLFLSIGTVLKSYCDRTDKCRASSKFEICYTSPHTEIEAILNDLDSKFPTFFIETEDGAVIPWDPRSYMYSKRDRDGTWCNAIENNGVDETVFGMSFIKNKMAIFDRAGLNIMILPGECPVTTDQTRDQQEGPNFSANSLPPQDDGSKSKDRPPESNPHADVIVHEFYHQ
eukprot:GHVH01006352.1.p1 GENE.GHVH01006352.1~~GHVH01006352.1.p1  ORF type:complete len:508 (+),score=48.30 GHVH01006352.1:98-1621(+)